MGVKNTTHNLIFQVFICEVVRSVEKVKEGRKKIIGLSSCSQMRL